MTREMRAQRSFKNLFFSGMAENTSDFKSKIQNHDEDDKTHACPSGRIRVSSEKSNREIVCLFKWVILLLRSVEVY